jgi:membrane-associated phospholipid phosphatase
VIRRHVAWAVLLIFGVLLIGFAVTHGYTREIDSVNLGAVALRDGQSSAWLIAAARFVSWTGDTPRRVPVVLVCGAWLFFKRRPVAAWGVMLVPLVTLGASSLLKLEFARVRPDLVPHLDRVTDLSFPSGHASNAAAFFLIAALVMPMRNHGAWVALAAVGAVLLGFSRNLLGVHWPTDVLAGLMLGTAVALIGAATVRRFEQPQIVRA